MRCGRGHWARPVPELSAADQLEPRAGGIRDRGEPAPRRVLGGPLDLASKLDDLLEGGVDVFYLEVDRPRCGRPLGMCAVPSMIPASASSPSPCVV